MKTIITSVKGPPLRRVLCSFLFGAAAFCVVPTHIQAGDIVWVTTGYTIAEYNGNGTSANGTAINTNFITEPRIVVKEPIARVGSQIIYGSYSVGPYLGGILVSGPILYVGTVEGVTWSYLQWTLQHPSPSIYVMATYNAVTGNVIQNGFPNLGLFGPLGMVLSAPYPAGPYGGPYLYVARQGGSICKIATTGGGNSGTAPSFISSNFGGPQAPYALAVSGNVLYVTNNAQNSNGDFSISTYTADTGALIKANFIQRKTTGLYGLALQGNTLYVSVYSGIAPGVYTYKADTGEAIKGPFVSVNEPWGIAIEGNTLYVASYQDSMIYEFEANTGVKLSGSIKVSAPTNITVEPADEQ